MPSAALLISFFQAVTILGSALTVLKLLTTGLYRRYRIFFAYFVFRLPYMTLFLVLTHLRGLPGGNGSSSYLYFWAYIISQPFLFLAYILVVVALYSLVLERYKGLYTFGRWAMYGAVLISTMISMLSLLPKIAPSTPEPSRLLYYEIAMERGMDLALVIFILLIVWFLSRYPVPLSRNVVVQTVIYSLLFLSDAVVLLWRTLLGYQVMNDQCDCFGGFRRLRDSVVAAAQRQRRRSAGPPTTAPRFRGAHYAATRYAECHPPQSFQEIRVNSLAN